MPRLHIVSNNWIHTIRRKFKGSYCNSMWMHLQYHFSFVDIKHSDCSITVSSSKQGHEVYINLLVGGDSSSWGVTDCSFNDTILFYRGEVYTCACLKKSQMAKIILKLTPLTMDNVYEVRPYLILLSFFCNTQKSKALSFQQVNKILKKE